MSVTVAPILAELKQIAQRSPEDVAVLMAPLLRAFEEVEAGRDPKIDHAQIMAMANSLAQTSAQAGDMDVAVAIATLSAEIEQIPAEVFEPPAEPLPQAPPQAQAPPEKPDPFARPYQQLLGVLAICALSYGGYLHIHAKFLPGSVTSWLLTGSSSLLALGLALGWRRFVLKCDLGTRLTAAALMLAMASGAWSVYTKIDLQPRITPTAKDQAATSPAGDTRSDPAVAADGTESANGETDPEDDEPIEFWWLGQTPQQPTTRIPRAPSPTTDVETADAGAGNDADTAEGTDTPYANRPLPLLPPEPVAPVRQSQQPNSPRARYEGLLQRDVVVVDLHGARHEGKLTGVSNHGVTVLTEVMMFGEPILAHRFYLFDNIERLREK